MSSGGSSDLLVDEALGENCWPKFARRWPAASREEKVFVADHSKAAQAEEEEGNNDAEEFRPRGPNFRHVTVTTGISSLIACTQATWRQGLKQDRWSTPARDRFPSRGGPCVKGKLCLCSARVEYGQRPHPIEAAGRLRLDCPASFALAKSWQEKK
jgi:hypothetical protein